MKKLTIALLACGLPLVMNAQAAFDALQMTQNELRGTSRFMSMAGAFGALGGDISVLNQNPGGIGVYRSSDAGITLSVDANKSETDNKAGLKISDDQTRSNVNNVGYVGAIKTGSELLPNFNFGFSYNRNMDFHRHYRGTQPNIQNSVTNYIAANTSGWKSEDLGVVTNDQGQITYNPYYETTAPWASVLSYNSYLINNNNNAWQGLLGNGTSGNAEYEVDQSGHSDEYNIAFGGNFVNKVYWGASFGIIDLDYDNYMYYGESLQNAYIYDYNAGDGSIVNGNADFGYENFLHTDGTGYNFKFGLILKPVNELRFGFAFHTPTYYDLKDHYTTNANFRMQNSTNDYYGTNYTGDGTGFMDEVRYNIHTPWRFIGSVAAVIGHQGMIDFDYEYVGTSGMRVCDDDGHAYRDVTANIEDYMQATHIFRIGGEYRIDPKWSVRAGYSYQTSPVKDEVKDHQLMVTTVSNNPAFEYDKSVQYVTCGFGYRYKAFYADLAYVYKHRKSEYNAFSSLIYQGGSDEGLYQDVKDNDHHISLTLGIRF